MSKILLTNAFIQPITSAPFYGDILIENNKIIEMSPFIQLNKENVVEIDCKNYWLLPGFIDTHTHLGLYNESISGWIGNDANEQNHFLNPHHHVKDAINIFDSAFYDAYSNGITTVNVLPGSFQIIGGQCCAILTYGESLDDMIINEHTGLKIALGENPKQKTEMSRMGIVATLRELFDETTLAKTTFYNSSIKKVLDKKIPIRVHAHRRDDILTAIKFANDFHIDLCLEHCTEGHLILEQIPTNIPITLGPTMTRKSKYELANKSWDIYPLLNKQNEISITTDHPYVPIQYLPICAAITTKYGLTDLEALKAITINPAKNLKIDHLVGSIEKDKLANLVLWDGNPFNYKSNVLWTMINGKIIFQKM